MTLPGTLQAFPEIAQRTDEWFAQRCGIVTASVVGKLLEAVTA